MTNDKPVVVVGSINIDICGTSPRHPHPGETLLGSTFTTSPGGKGANQAIAASRFGAAVRMIACVGTDEYGEYLLNNLQSYSINTDSVLKMPNISSGVAMIIVAQGENAIVVLPGANTLLTPNTIAHQEAIIRQAGVVLLQHEIPMETVQYVIELCAKHEVPIILNPAPALTWDPHIITMASYITPNEHECAVVFGSDDIAVLLPQYANKLIVTEGAKGIRYHDSKKEIRIPAHTVQVQDSTGAGDTFNGVFAACLAKHYPLNTALTYATIAASLSTTKKGAQSAMPTQEQTEYIYDGYKT